ncbi:hypothetical protein OBBRIDRAFT_836526 [Obba rivulosa]|uniref:Uncharacterized protein n=1 Tax=Obba rivulosa TaxID=1052685 RepID=A0A8E2ASK5_9APHY|nr:hypothetical protein OBBRIDRAFT_836526 [Obba rivulosa]
MDTDKTLEHVATRFAEAAPSASDSMSDSSTTADRDAATLAKLGYKQELRRAFTPLEVFGLGFVLLVCFRLLLFAIPNGGLVALVWGWTVCLFFLVFIGLALAEFGSAAPTSGGLYYWTYIFAFPRYRRVLSWIVGCSLATRIIARLQGIYIWLNVLLCVAVIIALPASTPKEFRNSASHAFGGFANFYGWPDGFAFILSFLAPLWTIGGFDASVHISEEASNTRVAVPWAAVWSSQAR